MLALGEPGSRMCGSFYLSISLIITNEELILKIYLNIKLPNTFVLYYWASEFLFKNTFENC